MNPYHNINSKVTNQIDKKFDILGHVLIQFPDMLTCLAKI